MSKFAFALFLMFSVKASAQDILLAKCQNLVALGKAKAQASQQEYDKFNQLVLKHKSAAEKIVAEDQVYLEDLLTQAYLNMPELRAYARSARDLPESSPLRTVLQDVLHDVYTKLDDVVKALTNNPRSYDVSVRNGLSLNLAKTYDLGGLPLYVTASTLLRLTGKTPQLLISTSAHTKGPRYGPMTTGMKIINLETGEEIFGLGPDVRDWGGVRTKQTLVEPLTKWQEGAKEMIKSDQASESSSITACEAYIAQKAPASK